MRTAFALAAVVALFATVTRAAPVDYTVDPARSTFRLGGTFDDASLSPQSAGSDLTGYAGVLLVDVNRAANTLSFGGTPNALDQPTDQLPASQYEQGANYGMTTGGVQPTHLAVRGLDLWVRAEDDPYNTGSGEISFFVNGGTFYWRTAGSPSGFAADLHGYSGPDDVTGPVTLTTEGDLEVLTIPIQSRITPWTGEDGPAVVFTLSGRLVATRLVPEPGTAGLFLAAMSLIARRPLRKPR